jgi:uncharacterized membrane protein YagU involved in acid resistance
MSINWASWLMWGFASTIVLTTIAAASQGMGLTRMSIPYMLGTMFTPGRDRAKLTGFCVHLLNGWVFSLVYVVAFHQWQGPEWWKGAMIGGVHALFVLTVGMIVLPGLHPRMAGEAHGPTVVKQLEPPGFLALNYGATTPLAVLFAHVVFGAILGWFYQPMP